jgi:hypothetical protein
MGLLSDFHPNLVSVLIDEPVDDGLEDDFGIQ